jgi:hypothetical protein
VVVYVQNIIRFIMSLLVQMLIINQVDFGAASPYIYPLFYVMFVALLPLSIPRALLILLAFTHGIVVDLFMNTGGLHASSLVLLAFVRPYLLRAIAPREDFDPNRPINTKYLGFRRFLIYISLCIAIQHFWFFAVEYFRFSELHIILAKTISNGFFTLILILIYDTLTHKR